jgi:radical SAM protein with 4Fe4S-binding SPASM domain
MLRGWKNLPYVLINADNNQYRELNSLEFQTLSFCNGDTQDIFVLEAHEKLAKEFLKLKIIKYSNGINIKDHQKYFFYDCEKINQVHWSITRNCNYNCRHCYVCASEKKYKDTSTKECIEIVKQISECGITNISLTGGEAFVRPDFWQIVDSITENKIKISRIYTNGFLVNKNLIDNLKLRNIKPEFSISFDGIGAHDWLRGIKGAEKIAINAFKLLNQNGYRTFSEMCLYKDNIKNISETVNLLTNLGVSGLKINIATMVGSWVKNYKNHNINIREAYNAFLEYIPEFFRLNSPLNLQMAGFFVCFKNSKEFSIPAVKPIENQKLNNLSICEHARQILYLSSSGQVLPCVSLDFCETKMKKTFINKKNSLKKILNNSHYLDLKNLKISEIFKKNKKCATCKYVLLCGGGCRANASIAGNSFFGNDPQMCVFFKENYFEKIKACLE